MRVPLANPRKNKSGKVGKFLRASIINKSHGDEYQGGVNLKPPIGDSKFRADARRARWTCNLCVEAALRVSTRKKWMVRFPLHSVLALIGITDGFRRRTKKSPA